MEKSLRDLSGLIKTEERDWSQYSPLPLAYMGDAVYDLLIRTALLRRGNMQAEKLHREAVAVVNARMQANIADALREDLTAQELSVYRRGHNSKPLHTAKNATREEYLKATGLEALVGYLYLNGEYARLLHLLQTGLERCGADLVLVKECTAGADCSTERR